jgi:gluconate 5-dehydrogenase
MTLNVFDLTGETALITGGGSGLGLGIAHCMAQAGAKVVLVGRRESVLKGSAAKIGKLASYVAADVTEFDRAKVLIDRAAQAAGGSPVTILVNNAGNHIKKSATETTAAEFNAILQTHVLASHALTAAALPGMIERKRGSILFTASMTSFLGLPLVVAYSAAKSAYVGMVRSLAAETAPHGIRVNAIAPGWIESEMLRRALAGDEQRTQKILQRTPMNRFGDPSDIGWAAVYLCSPAAKFITGVILPVDGGASATL